jgi:hypothetical protein
MSQAEFAGLSVLGGPISPHSSRTTAAGTQADGGELSRDPGMFVDPRMVGRFASPHPVGSSQTGPMSFVEAVGKIIV